MRVRSPWIRAGSFLLALLVVGACFQRLHEHASTRLAEQRRATIERLTGRSIVFLGDSHVQCAVDDRGKKGFVNLATASEHYVLTLQKLRMLRPRVVVVGTWIHNFLPSYERLLGRVYLKRYSIWTPPMTEEERHDVVARLEFELWAFAHVKRWVPFLGTRLADESREVRRGLGGFHPHPGRTKVGAQGLDAYVANLQDAGDDFPSAFQERHLDAIIEHCESQGIKVVLLSTPVGGKLSSSIPPAIQSAYKETIVGLRARHGVPHWDYSSLHLDDAMFRDLDHLNVRGAQVFTRLIATRLRREGLMAKRTRPPLGAAP